MMNHLREIEDAAVRHGVDRFKTQMEILVLSLLHENPDVALVQIAEARAVSLGYLDEFDAPDAPPISADHVAKAGRIATAMLEHSFERLRIVIESRDDDAVH